MGVLPQGWDKTSTPGRFAPLTSDHVPEMQTGFIVRMGEYFLSKIQWNSITTHTSTFWWRLISCKPRFHPSSSVSSVFSDFTIHVQHYHSNGQNTNNLQHSFNTFKVNYTQSNTHTERKINNNANQPIICHIAYNSTSRVDLIDQCLTRHYDFILND